MSFGEVLRELRGEKSQSEIAAELGITKSSWAMYEKNKRVPRDEVKIIIANHFNVSVQDIFFAERVHK